MHLQFDHPLVEVSPMNLGTYVSTLLDIVSYSAIYDALYFTIP